MCTKSDCPCRYLSSYEESFFKTLEELQHESWQGDFDDASSWASPSEYCSEIEAAALKEHRLFNVASQKHQMSASEDDNGCSSYSPVCFQFEFFDVDEECSCGSGKLFSECHDTHTAGASCCCNMTDLRQDAPTYFFLRSVMLRVHVCANACALTARRLRRWTLTYDFMLSSR